MYQPYILFCILILTLVLFIWGYWRYDFVALLALILSVITGIVPANQAFSGFSNPAVITVGCVMILTYAITQSGVLTYVVNKIELLFDSHLMIHITLLSLISAVLSAFMNNVGALGLMMPIAISTFIKNKQSPSIILMPIAFTSVLGGIITLIGTPPNLLIAAYRKEVLGEPYHMFSFTAAGLPTALIAVLFIILIGWRFVPAREKYDKTEDLFQISDYVTEVKVPKESPLCKKTVKEFFEQTEADFDLIAIIHKGTKKFAFTKNDVIQANDILIIEASHDNLEKLLASSKLSLVWEKPFSSKELTDANVSIIEAVVPPDASVEGRSAAMLKLHTRYGMNLLAISRKGISFRKKLVDIRLTAGDIVLLQGNVDTLRETVVDLGFLPLATRDVKIGLSQKNILPILFFIMAIIIASLQIYPITITFAAAIVGLVIFKAIPIYNLYRSINWSVLLLLAAIIPVGGAMQTTGAADLIANIFTHIAGQYSPLMALIAVLVVTMTLSDLMNNAATAVIMAPIAFNIANAAHVNVDTFLMAVAIGASCSFLTPIAHQNNTMVMGPGGYRFYDYIRLGLPVEIVVVIVAIPSLLWAWPL